MADTIDWLQLLQQFQWLFGAIAAAGGAFIVQWRRDRSKQAEQRRTVAMLLASQLRKWVVRSVSMLRDIDNANATGGAFGSWHSHMPEFDFEVNLGQVAQLNPKEAENIFNLVHEKAEIHDGCASTVDFVDGVEAARELNCKWAQLVLKSLEVYRHLASLIGWSPEVLSEYDVTFVGGAAMPPKHHPATHPPIPIPIEDA